MQKLLLYDLHLYETCIIFRYMGTITGIADLDPVRWPNSHWRSVKVCEAYMHKLVILGFGNVLIVVPSIFQFVYGFMQS